MGDLETDPHHQVIYLDENTLILEEENEVQYVIPSNLSEANRYLVEQDEVHFDYINNGDNILDGKNQILISQEELVDSQNISKEESSPTFEVDSEGPETVTQLILNEEQCQLLHGCGRLILVQGSKHYLLDAEGLREIEGDADQNDYEYVLSAQTNCEDQNDILLADNNITFENSTQVLRGIDENHENVETTIDTSSNLKEALLKSTSWVTNTSESNVNQQNIIIKSANKTIETNTTLQNQRIPIKRKGPNILMTAPKKKMLVNMQNHEKIEKRIESPNKKNPANTPNCGNSGSSKKIFIGKTDDGKKLYGKIIGVKTENSIENVINDEYECSLSSKILTQLLEAGKKIIKPSPNRFVEEKFKEKNYEPNKTNSEKIIIGKDDAKVKNIFFDTVEDKELNTEPIIDVCRVSELEQVEESQNWFESSIEEIDPEQLRKEIEFIKDTMTTLQTVPHIMNVIVGKDLMFCRVFENESSNDANKKSFVTGRMVKINNEWQFVHMSDLHNYEEIGKGDTNNVVNQEEWKEDEEFLEVTDYSPKQLSKCYICDICKRPFNRLSNLLRHARIHSSIDLEVSSDCDVKSKSKSSSDGSSGEYACHLCPCSYKFPSTLTRHILSQHSECITVNK